MLGNSRGFLMSAFAGASVFSTGMDSPVSVDWLMNRSFATKTRASAGTISPAERKMISPGTSSFKGISIRTPARCTVAVVLTISLSFSAAESARFSWTKRNVTLRITIEKITTPARKSFVIMDIIPRTRSKIFNGSLNIFSKRAQTPSLFSVAISLYPCSSKRALTSSSLNPSDWLLICWSTSCVSD